MTDKGRYVAIPAADYPPIEQAAIILKSSTNKETARQFVEFVKSPASLELLRNYGFETSAPAVQ
jgi:molybdate transport system substrate-binding protein